MAKVERTHAELEMVRGHKKAQAAQGTGGTTSWFVCCFKVCNQHLFHTDNVMLIYTFGELMSSHNTHLKKSRLESSSLDKQTLGEG